MTDIEQKALELTRKGTYLEVNVTNMSAIAEAYRSLHERHEAFKQEVSDAVEHCRRCSDPEAWTRIKFELARFIIAKPDPLVEALREVDTGPVWDSSQDYANKVRAALAKRGLEIVEKK